MKVVQVTNENAKFALEVSSGMTNWVDDPEQTLKCLFLLSDPSKMREKTICVHLERSFSIFCFKFLISFSAKMDKKLDGYNSYFKSFWSRSNDLNFTVKLLQPYRWTSVTLLSSSPVSEQLVLWNWFLSVWRSEHALSTPLQSLLLFFIDKPRAKKKKKGGGAHLSVLLCAINSKVTQKTATKLLSGFTGRSNKAATEALSFPHWTQNLGFGKRNAMNVSCHRNRRVFC